WITRRYRGNGRYAVENLRTQDGQIVIADDYDDADGTHNLTFAQAQRAAKGPRTGASGSLTVANVISDYLDHLRRNGRSPHAMDDANRRAVVHILPALGAAKVAALTPDRLRRWHDEMATAAPRLRTRPGSKQNYREAPNDYDGRRARRSTANR